MKRRKKLRNAALAVAYVRVSTDEQQNGPEAQRAAVEAWALQRGVTIAAWCEDLGISGATPLEERPGLLAALRELQAHEAGWLVAAKRDRLARDVIVAATLQRFVEKQGAQVVTADGVAMGSGPEAELMRTMIDAFAQYERGLIRLRTKAALAVKKARGERISGHPPFGFKFVDGRVEINKREQKVIRRIFELSNDGLSVRKIAAQLNEEDAPHRGQGWAPTAVWNILDKGA